MKKKNMILLAGALAASMLIGGCSKEKTESETTGSPAQGEISNETQGTQIVEKGDEIVTMAITASWDTLNIYNTSGNYGNAVADQMFERLVTRTHDGEVLPRLAESWEMSEDESELAGGKDHEALSLHESLSLISQGEKQAVIRKDTCALCSQ